MPKVPLLKRGVARPCPQIYLVLNSLLFLLAFGWHRSFLWVASFFHFRAVRVVYKAKGKRKAKYYGLPVCPRVLAPYEALGFRPIQLYPPRGFTFFRLWPERDQALPCNPEPKCFHGKPL